MNILFEIFVYPTLLLLKYILTSSITHPINKFIYEMIDTRHCAKSGSFVHPSWLM